MDTENYEADEYEIDDDEFEVEDDEAGNEEGLEEDSETDSQESSFTKDGDEDEEKSLLKKNLARLKKDFYRTAHENKTLKERLNQNSSDFRNFNDFSYSQAEENIKLQIAQAKYEQEKAFGEQDLQGFQKTIEDIARATSKLENLKVLKSQEDRRQASYSQPAEDNVIDPDAQEWLERNSWYVPNSPDFDYKKHMEIDAYARKRNEYLISVGRQNEIYGHDYLDKIDQRSKLYDQKNNSRAPSMKSQVVPVGAVRPTANSFEKQKAKKKITLGSEDKKIADSIGMAHSEYAKYVMAQNTDNKFR